MSAEALSDLPGEADSVRPLEQLETGPSHLFSDWPNRELPKVAAGVYTIWERDRLIYVGMAGRGMNASDTPSPDEPTKAKGLSTRLNSHASGRRSGDQFCVYVCDRFVVPRLSLKQQTQVGEGTLSLDGMTRKYIHDRFGYRFVTTADGQQAFELERRVQRGELRAGKPVLNPG